MASFTSTSQYSQEVLHSEILNFVLNITFWSCQEKINDSETITSSLDSYRAVKIIGHCFDAGRVLLATAKECQSSSQSGLVAVKQYSLDNCQRDLGLFLKVYSRTKADSRVSPNGMWLQEVWLMRHLKHKNILTCTESFVLHQNLHIVTPLCNYGSALDLIQSHFYNGFPESVIAGILRDVLQVTSVLTLSHSNLSIQSK